MGVEGFRTVERFAGALDPACKVAGASCAPIVEWHYRTNVAQLVVARVINRESLSKLG